MKAKVDKDLCAGCGVCTEVCPELFEMDENDLALVRLVSSAESLPRRGA